MTLSRQWALSKPCRNSLWPRKRPIRDCLRMRTTSFSSPLRSRMFHQDPLHDQRWLRLIIHLRPAITTRGYVCSLKTPKEHLKTRYKTLKFRRSQRWLDATNLRENSRRSRTRGRYWRSTTDSSQTFESTNCFRSALEKSFTTKRSSHVQSNSTALRPPSSFKTNSTLLPRQPTSP